MHLLTNSKPIPMGRYGTLQPGRWVCDDLNAAELLLMGERGTSTIHPDWRTNNIPGTMSLLIIRSGAIGDLLFLSPAIAAYQEKNPDVRVTLACFSKHHEIVADLVGVELTDYPVAFDKLSEFNQVLALENVMEKATDKHATDAFAEVLGVPVTDYKPRFEVSELFKIRAREKFPRFQKLRVGIQPMASVSNRDYPFNQWAQVFQQLVQKHDAEIYLFGGKGQIPPLPPQFQNITNLSEHDLTFRQSAAILSTCDVFCGVDSCWLPVCHALDVPAVGLYAAFDWKTRTAKAPLTFALTGHAACAPCSWHRHAGQNFPPDQECAKRRFCLPLAGIEPDRIVSKILSIPRHAGTT